jgi:hypothetical protein
MLFRCGVSAKKAIMNSRDQILGSLRTNRRPFPDTPPRPNPYMSVTRFGTAERRLARFTAEAERRFAKVYVAADEQSAINTILSLCEADKTVMAWENL